MLPPQLARAVIRNSGRKAIQLFGFTIARGIDVDDRSSDSSEGEDTLVWDVSDPFSPQDPADQRLHGLIQAEIAHMRRYESIGPLQSLPHDDDDDDGDSVDSGAVTVPDSDSDSDSGAGADSEDEHPNPIALPQLLHTRPICGFVSSTEDDDDDDLEEAEEQERARKAKRDALRSRLKALAILGHEAISAFK